jgi:hypothetical protein
LSAADVDSLCLVLSERAFDVHYTLPGNARTVREWLKLDDADTWSSALDQQRIVKLLSVNGKMELGSVATQALQSTATHQSPLIRVHTTWPLRLRANYAGEADILTSDAQLLHLYGLTGATVPYEETLRGSRVFAANRQRVLKQLAQSSSYNHVSAFVFCGFHVAEDVVGDFGDFVQAHYVYWMHSVPPPQHSGWERATWIFCDNVSRVWPDVLSRITGAQQ